MGEEMKEPAELIATAHPIAVTFELLPRERERVRGRERESE
jgi:hypothetical protein